MDTTDDDATLRFIQIEQFPQVKLMKDDIHSNCSICIGDFNKDEIILILPCVHKFHSCCINTWLSKHNTCPTCREKVIHNVCEEFAEDEDDDDDELVNSSIDSSDNASPEIVRPSDAIVFNILNSIFYTEGTSSSDMSPFEQNSENSDVSLDSYDTFNSTPDLNESHESTPNLTVSEISVSSSDSSLMSIDHSDESDDTTDTSLMRGDSLESLHNTSTLTEINSQSSSSSNNLSISSCDESDEVWGWEVPQAVSSDDYSD